MDQDPGLDPAALLARADAARDTRDWPDAALGYAAYLAREPAAWAIWVQYGHAVKEAGDSSAALQLYREAERLNPTDADLQLQIGHALKLLGRVEEAYQHYARALELDPDNTAARTELLMGTPGAMLDATAPHGAAPQPAMPEAAPRLLFDVSDLLDYARANRAPTGIQRVQMNVVEHALAAAPGVVAVAFDAPSGSWKTLPAAAVADLVRLARGGADAADPDWTAAVAQLREAVRGGARTPLAAGAALVNLGTSWWIPDYLRRVRAARRGGLRYVAFLHDCIPLIVPEHCEPRLTAEFARWFAGLCAEADLVLCNSRCTQADFLRLSGAVLPGIVLPTAVVPLDAAWPAGGAAAEPPARPYVLFVGTIESRKDHLLVFHAWLSLLRRHGPAAVPDLVCVGKRGWLADPALHLHEQSAALRGHVRLLHDVADAALSGLYANARFTLYNSAYEGWGLPVTESLAHGKVALVPDHSSLREAGGAGAVFFSPGSAPELVAGLERLIFDEHVLAASEARLKREVRLRSWAELTTQLLAELDAAPPAPAVRLSLPLGTVLPIALLPGPAATPAMALADAVREGAGWARLEPWGAWTLPGESRLRLPLDRAAAVDGPLRLHLHLMGPPLPHRCGLRAGFAGAGGALRAIELAANEPAFATFNLAPGEGDLLVEFDNGAGVGVASRHLGVGVRAVMICRADDLAARLGWLERAALPRLVSF